ncbi:PTS sugar transporter subunit IIA domain-containing protein [Lactiplantibacillus carotarum]|uniref:PTS sugar transporter subunit IIA domain-containing protein n=1 Tax=Lactiplantibacillus carotarum TaxID=2993456 RepID=UPI00298EEE46|nr:PTS fructose transporter subunit IIA [Lactiplantibacillus carotarum]
MNYKLAIIGHGNYPDGVKSALKLFTGDDSTFDVFNLDDKTTHAAFQAELSQYLAKNERVIIMADMTGGAPHQEVAELLLKAGRPYQYIVSSAPLNLILDLYMQDVTGMLTDATVKDVLTHSVQQAAESIRITPTLNTPVSVGGHDQVEEDGI